MDIFFSPEDEWKSHGKCVGMDPRIFDGVEGRTPQHERDYTEARKACLACPVRGFCLDDAVRNREAACMRGAKTPGEVTVIRRGLAKKLVSA